MFGLLYDFFLNLFYDYADTNSFMELRYTFKFYNNGHDDVLQTIEVGDYLATLCSIVSLIIILVLCCLFIYRLIRVVGRLFMGA